MTMYADDRFFNIRYILEDTGDQVPEFAGMDRLPVIVVDGHVVSTGVYLYRDQLATKLGLDENQANPKPHIKITESGCCKPSSGCC